MCEARLWEEAAEHLKSLEKLQWVDANEAKLWRARILSEQGDHEEAVRVAKQAYARSAKQKRELAVVLARAGDEERAAREINDALVQDMAGSYMAIGQILEALGEDETALVHFERAEWATSCAEREEAMGRVLMRLGDYGEAAAAYERAIRARRFLLGEDVRALVDSYRHTGRHGLADEVERLALND